MLWPHEIISAFGDALVIELQNGTPKDEIIAAMLDWAMRRAVWRTGGDPTKAEGALRSPYTPLGSVCGDGLDGRVSKFTLKGDKWGPAVQAWYAYILKNVDAVFDAFRDQGEEYDDSLS